MSWRSLTGQCRRFQDLNAAAWHEQMGDLILADSILDRLVHYAHCIEMRGRFNAQN
jgi:hypothetical protein